jgi:hypothetical protein
MAAGRQSRRSCTGEPRTTPYSAIGWRSSFRQLARAYSSHAANVISSAPFEQSTGTKVHGPADAHSSGRWRGPACRKMYVDTAIIGPQRTFAYPRTNSRTPIYRVFTSPRIAAFLRWARFGPTRLAKTSSASSGYSKREEPQPYRPVNVMRSLAQMGRGLSESSAGHGDVRSRSFDQIVNAGRRVMPTFS